MNKKNKLTYEMIKSVEIILINMANVETIKPIVLKYQKEILQKHKFNYKLLSDRRAYKKEGVDYISNPDHTYMLKEKDFKTYLQELDIVKKNYCPLLIAKNNLRKAKNNLIIAFKPYHGLELYEVTHSLKYYNQLVELILNYAIQFLKNKDEILNTNKDLVKSLSMGVV